MRRRLSPEMSVNTNNQELRYYAYFRGNITSPVPITMDPFVPQVKESTITALAGSSEDKLQSQCALPEYSGHSPEVCRSSVYPCLCLPIACRQELRVAFMLFGREMTSNDLNGPQVAPTSATPSASSLIPQTAPAVSPFAIAAPASKFNFVFR